MLSWSRATKRPFQGRDFQAGWWATAATKACGSQAADAALDGGGDPGRLRPRSPSVRRGFGVRGVVEMQPLYEGPWFTFRFADNRLIPRFHLEGVEAGRRVSVFKIDPATGERLGLLATAAVCDGGWVDLSVPVVVKAGNAFIAVPDPAPR